jgi:hypothetical protein
MAKEYACICLSRQGRAFKITIPAEKRIDDLFTETHAEQIVIFDSQEPVPYAFQKSKCDESKEPRKPTSVHDAK